MCNLGFVRVEREERVNLAYNLDAKRVDMFEVWCRVYDDFFLTRMIKKFSLDRHGLLEVVKYSISQEEKGENWQKDSIIAPNPRGML